FIKKTGMVEEFVTYDGPRSIDCLAFTEEMVSNLTERMERAANLFTVFYPMVVPPKPWTNSRLIGGAYYTENVQPYRFVKDAKHNYLSELENSDIDAILGPVNAMQNTGWRVNSVMVEVLDAVFSMNVDISSLPTADPQEIPAPPPGIEESEDIAAEYRKECYMVHDMNRRMISKRIAVLRTISMARKFAKYDTIYFPYDVDSRGRAYPKVPFLNPQGTDYVKSLLEFSEGKPIETPEHEAYLAIAIANAWGQDKLPLQERVQWVEDNEVMLQEVALDPLNDLRWTKADEPFMALRGALEWRGLCEHGYGFRSHMPVHFDATCSGLQHFSALLKDEEGGFHVNLTGHPERQDIYAA
ncbi:DNA-directed RNA polymerase, partial [Marinobacterium sp. xm-d-509]|uniref:DNA-directed RNA polymerase n=1 Tax=Marinobacterium sp. xm-d-509 TaxID=2497739 RepID=UPI001C2B9A3F